MTQILLTDLIPTESEIDVTRLESVQQRLIAILRDQYPDIDVSPNSVFADNVLRPMAYLVAGFEQAADCLFSDLDLANVVSGKVCDCDFVKDYLKNFGVYASDSVPTIATVRLGYTTNTVKTVENTARLVFGDDLVLKPYTATSSEITILPTSAQRTQTTQNVFRLTEDITGGYYVDIPVYGPSGGNETVGTTGTTDIIDETLDSVTLVSPIIPFTVPETISELAAKTQTTFPSSALTTRSSAISFFTHKLSNLAGVSPVVPGDPEMTRGQANLFGVQRNAVDIYPKGKSIVTQAQTTLTLVKDTSQGRWIGELATPQIPYRIRRILATDGTEIPVTNIVGASSDPTKFPGISGAFSSNEELGLIISDAYSGFIADGGVANTFATDTFAEEGALWASTMEVSGTYMGSIFSPSALYSLSFIGEESDTGGNDRLFTVKNTFTGETVTGAVATLAGAGYILDKFSGDSATVLERWLRGLTIEFFPNGIADDDFEGHIFTFQFQGESGKVVVEYDYDPFLEESMQLLSHDGLDGAFDISVLGPRPLVLSELTINYRTSSGRWVDTGVALTELMEYVNTGIYPDILEDSALSDILLYAGASGVSKIVKKGTLYTTLATLYSTDRRDIVDSGGSYWAGGVDYIQTKLIDYGSNKTTAEAVVLDTRGSYGYAGPRNIQFMLDQVDLSLVERRN